MNVGAHANLQSCFDRIDFPRASLAGIDEVTSETAFVPDVYNGLLLRPEWANYIASMASEMLDMKLASLRMWLVQMEPGVLMEKARDARAGAAGDSGRPGWAPRTRMTPAQHKGYIANVVCHNCKLKGHLARDCPHAGRQSRTPMGKRSRVLSIGGATGRSTHSHCSTRVIQQAGRLWSLKWQRDLIKAVLFAAIQIRVSSCYMIAQVLPSVSFI